MWGKSFFFFFFIRMSDAAANLFYQQGSCPFVCPLFISFGRLALFDMPPCVQETEVMQLSSRSLEDPFSQVFVFLSASCVDPGLDPTSKSRIWRLWDKPYLLCYLAKKVMFPLVSVVLCFFFFKCVEAWLSTDLHVSYFSVFPPKACWREASSVWNITFFFFYTSIECFVFLFPCKFCHFLSLPKQVKSNKEDTMGVGRSPPLYSMFSWNLSQMHI